MLRVGNIVLGHIDVDAGEFTYQNRIAFGELFGREDLTDYQKLAEAHREIYGYSARWLPRRVRLRRFAEIAEGLADWVKLEQMELKHNPSPEEIAAGIEEYSKEVGEDGTVSALAEQFGQTPMEVRRWPYAEAFRYLRANAKNGQFREKLNKQYTAKNAKHSRH